MIKSLSKNLLMLKILLSNKLKKIKHFIILAQMQFYGYSKIKLLKKVK